MIRGSQKTDYMLSVGLSVFCFSFAGGGGRNCMVFIVWLLFCRLLGETSFLEEEGGMKVH